MRGRTLTAGGSVTAVHDPDAAGEVLVDLAVFADDDTATRLVDGTASVLL